MRHAISDLPETIDSLYSNFDHRLDAAMLKLVEGGDCRGQHAGWNYCGWVWKDADGWHEAVFVYGKHDATFTAETVEGVITKVLDEYGRE